MKKILVMIMLIGSMMASDNIDGNTTLEKVEDDPTISMVEKLKTMKKLEMRKKDFMLDARIGQNAINRVFYESERYCRDNKDYDTCLKQYKIDKLKYIESQLSSQRLLIEKTTKIWSAK